MNKHAIDSRSLHCLAQAAGIAVRWVDAYDQPQVVSDVSLRAILSALQLPCASEDDCQASLAALQREQATGYLPPLLTAVAGRPLQLPQHSALHGQSCRLILEGGAIFELVISGDVSKPPTLPAILQPGYHQLLVAGHEVTLAVAPPRCYGIADALSGRNASASLQYNDSHPEPHPDARGWALAAQLYSLRSGSTSDSGDGGIGHFGALGALAQQAAQHGAAALAMSPAHAMFSAEPQRCSPYSPSSRLFFNVLHIDPAAVLGEAALHQVLSEGGPEMIARHLQLQQEPLIEWRQAGLHRLQLLRRLFAMFKVDGMSHPDYAAFKLEGGKALASHALYEAYSNMLAHQRTRAADIDCCNWRTWGEWANSPDTPQMQEFARQQAGEIEFHLFLQWQAASGLAAAQKQARDAGMAIGLIGDLAVGADNGGSQAWSHQEEIVSGLSVGAPPDRLSARGQNWALGAFSPLAMRRQGFSAYIAMLRACLRHAGGLRIDHVLGLNRLWLIPEGEDANEGAYVQYPLQDLLRLIALESWRHRAIVIGEDLGTVPPGFDRVLADAGLPGMRVLWFQRGEQGFLAPAAWPDSAIAATTTHDLPTVAGWWNGVDLAWRARLDLLDQDMSEEQAMELRETERIALWAQMREAGCATGEGAGVTDNTAHWSEAEEEEHSSQDTQAAIDAAIAFVAQTPAPLALVPLEDVLGLPQQPNLPGRTDPHPNWRRRMPADVGDLFDQPGATPRLARLASLRGQRRRPLTAGAAEGGLNALQEYQFKEHS
ncbi:4-alpha-glucanotransferase [Herbaspirillum lusitanum]|uniref:4-alpha-glucanotransferase n=1 Tax=Herbaspirillum lusitanum TaxID=213312 RepID=A0ABW9ACC5_9BURK